MKAGDPRKPNPDLIIEKSHKKTQSIHQRAPGLGDWQHHVPLEVDVG